MNTRSIALLDGALQIQNTQTVGEGAGLPTAFEITRHVGIA